jgi:hypothetical protein
MTGQITLTRPQGGRDYTLEINWTALDGIRGYSLVTKCGEKIECFWELSRMDGPYRASWNNVFIGLELIETVESIYSARLLARKLNRKAGYWPGVFEEIEREFEKEYLSN